MDKQKQIEEIAKILQRVYNCYGEFNAVWFAEHLAVNNIGKIPENAVVLTEEELKEKIDCCDVSMIHHDDDGKRYIEYEKYEDFTDRLGKRIQQLKGQLKQARKETVEKFAERLIEKVFIEFTDSDYDRLCFLVGEIAKEFTEGKK